MMDKSHKDLQQKEKYDKSTFGMNSDEQLEAQMLSENNKDSSTIQYETTKDKSNFGNSRNTKVHPVTFGIMSDQTVEREGTDDISGNVTAALNTDEDGISPKRCGDMVVSVTDFGINVPASMPKEQILD